MKKVSKSHVERVTRALDERDAKERIAAEFERRYVSRPKTQPESSK